MPLTDLTLAECLAYRPDLPEPAGLDRFWADALAAPPDTPARFDPVATGLTGVRTLDVTVPGHRGQPVRGWLQLPADPSGPLPCVVEYLGYGRGRGLPHQHLLWAAAGYAHLVMDTRGQGWSAAVGDTPDPDDRTPGAVPGLLTRGVLNPADHHYRRVAVDAVRFAQAARAHPAIDPDRVVVAGTSQGGGLALLVAGLLPGLAGVLADVPFLCHVRRGVDVATRGPYTEVVEYLRLHRDHENALFRTLAHFDAALLARRATAPALFSIALRDQVCPPSTCFAAYHNHGGPTELRVYPFNDHEGGGEHHQRAQLDWLRALLG